MNKREKILSYLPFLVLFVYMIGIHVPIQFSVDDLWFGDILNHQSYWDFISNRYSTWSSRLIIEAALITLTHMNIIVWKVLDCFIYTGIAFVLSLILGKNKIQNNWLCVMLCLLYPFSTMSSAGYVATTMNYTWPLFFILLFIYLIKKNHKGCTYTVFEYILLFISLIIGGNTEQGAAIIFGLLFMYCIILFVEKRKPSIIIFISYGINILQLLFIFTCPGNAARKIAEAQTYMPADYSNYGLLRLLDMGISSTFYNYIFVFDGFFLIFSFAILMKGIECTNKFWKRAIISFPFIVTLLFSVLKKITYDVFPGIKSLAGYLTDKGTIDMSDWHTFIPYLLYALVTASILFFIGILYKDDKEIAVEILIALILGFGSRIMMSFSASIWMSQSRTFIYLTFAFAISILEIFKKLNHSNFQGALIYLSGVLMTLSILNQALS